MYVYSSVYVRMIVDWSCHPESTVEVLVTVVVEVEVEVGWLSTNPTDPITTHSIFSTIASNQIYNYGC